MATWVKVETSDGELVTSSNPFPVSLMGSNLIQQLTEADAVAGVLTFAAPITTVEVYNTDAANAGTFTVNGIVIHVPAGKVFKSGVGGTPSAEVTITGATTYIVSRYT